MTHFVVTVCLTEQAVQASGGWRGAVTDALAPFDENTRVEPYKSYEEGDPSQLWFVWMARRDQKDYAEGTGILPYMPDAMWSLSSEGSKQTPEEQREEQRVHAAIADRLGDNPTWADVAREYNQLYHPTNQLVPANPLGPADSTDTDDEDGRYYVEDDGRAYKWSTYNPLSKWDWWVTGGRWQRAWCSVPDWDPALIVVGKPGVWGDNKRPNMSSTGAVYCDGGRKDQLDRVTLREEHRVEALKRYDQWHALVAEHPDFVTRQELAARVERGELAQDELATAYRRQPAIVEAEKLHVTDWFTKPEELYGGDRDEFGQEAADRAGLGYALLTTDGQWWAKGEKGWWDTGTDTESSSAAFVKAANDYLDALPDNAWIIQVDCHI